MASSRPSGRAIPETVPTAARQPKRVDGVLQRAGHGGMLMACTDCQLDPGRRKVCAVRAPRCRLDWALTGPRPMMNDAELRRQPDAIRGIVSDTAAMSFNMMSETRVGSLLATLAASKPAGRLLELGTGTGHGTAWLLAGMDAASILDTVDTDASVVAVAQRHLRADNRVRFHVMDGAAFLRDATPGRFDLIYADAWPGKFSHLDEALALLRPGGMYVIDDLLPQANWPEDHGPKVAALIRDIERRDEFTAVRLAWASGLMLVVRRAG
jgi:predicted O-methyltransferase YrrM